VLAMIPMPSNNETPRMKPPNVFVSLFALISDPPSRLFRNEHARADL
jgi:hypothetical protein